MYPPDPWSLRHTLVPHHGLVRDLELVLPDIAGIAVYDAGASYGPRAMHEYEFVWMLEGDAEYRWGERTVAAPEGSVVLCRPGATDFFRWDRSRRTRHGFFHFQITRIPAHWPQPVSWPLVRVPSDPALSRMLFQSFITSSESAPDVARLAAELMLAAYVHDALLVDAIPSAPLPKTVELAWTSINQQLTENPAAEITLAWLAAVAGVSPAHLCRQFTAAIGRSPMRAVAQVRLDLAAMMVTSGDDPISAIAERCGYANPFHFSRAFRRSFGRSPLAVRRDSKERGIPVTRQMNPLPRVRGR